MKASSLKYTCLALKTTPMATPTTWITNIRKSSVKARHSHIIPVVMRSTCHKTLQLSQLVLASQTHSQTGQHNVLYDPSLYYATTDSHVYYALFIYTRYLAGSGFTITWCRCLLLAFCEWLYSRDAMIGSDLGSDRNVDLGPLPGDRRQYWSGSRDVLIFAHKGIHKFFFDCAASEQAHTAHFILFL